MTLFLTLKLVVFSTVIFTVGRVPLTSDPFVNDPSTSPSIGLGVESLASESGRESFRDEDRPWMQRSANTVRFATFNLALNRGSADELTAELKSGQSRQAQQLAEILQRVRPDVVLLNELDRDESGVNVKLFHDLYLNVSQNGQEPLAYAYQFFAPSNTGEPSGLDLNNNQKITDPDDAFGYGQFPGQYAMAVLSRIPFDNGEVRTFQKLRWNSMPQGLWTELFAGETPDGRESAAAFYSKSARDVFRLSSKSHWILPLQLGKQTIHFVVAHPTPPVFDGPEDRNGRRNHDEIRLLADLVDPQRGAYAVDDQGRSGGLPTDAAFVIAGDLNADPFDGDSTGQAIDQLLKHPLIQADPAPKSRGAVEASRVQGGVNERHRGDPSDDTADFNDRSVGNMRVDYVLPSKNLQVTSSGVFWPPSTLPEAALVEASDHRLVWVDILPEKPGKRTNDE